MELSGEAEENTYIELMCIGAGKNAMPLGQNTVVGLHASTDGNASMVRAAHLSNSAVAKASREGASIEQCESAIQELREALSMTQERVSGGNWSTSQDCAAIYNNIANVNFVLERYGDALDSYQKALEIYEKLPSGHLTIQKDVASCIANIGLAFECQGQYEEAMVHYTRAFSVREKVLGDSEETRCSLIDCADAFETQGRLIDDSNMRSIGAFYRKRGVEMAARLHPPAPPVTTADH